MLISRTVRTKRVLAGAAGGLLIAATLGAVASATIPGDGNVYNACMLKNVGTIRLIDPSLASSNLMSHCTSLETPVSWNQKGLPGAAGPAGTKGDKGDPGAQGPPGVFAGTLTSPNGAYSISVTDTGIVLRAPSASARLVGSDITLDSGGSTTAQAGTSFGLVAGTNLSLASGGNTTLQTAKSLAASSGSDTTLTVGKDLSVAVGDTTSFQGGGNVAVAIDGTTNVHGAGDVTVDSGGAATLRGATGVLLSSPGPGDRERHPDPVVRRRDERALTSQASFDSRMPSKKRSLDALSCLRLERRLFLTVQALSAVAGTVRTCHLQDARAGNGPTSSLPGSVPHDVADRSALGGRR